MDRTTMSVQELSAQMGISLPKAYELVKQQDYLKNCILEELERNMTLPPL